MLNSPSATPDVTPKVGSASLDCGCPLYKDRGKDLYFYSTTLSQTAVPRSSPGHRHCSSSTGCCNPCGGIFSWGSGCLSQPQPGDPELTHKEPTHDSVPAVPGHGPAPRRPRAPPGRAGCAGHGSMPELCFPGPGRISLRKIVSAGN